MLRPVGGGDCATARNTGRRTATACQHAKRVAGQDGFAQSYDGGVSNEL